MKKLPKLTSDEEAERFLETADLSEFDLSGGQFTRFECAPKSARVNMRLPQPLLQAVRSAAEARGIPYQRFIRQALEAAVSKSLHQQASQDRYS